MNESSQNPAGRRLLRRALSVLGALAMTLAFYLVLPLIQAISQPASSELMLQTVDTADLPPPPPPLEEEPQEEQEEEQPPQLEEASDPLDLAQIETMLDLDSALSGEGWVTSETLTKLPGIATRVEDVDEIISMADLDQEPRVVYTVQPVLTAEVRKKAPGRVHVLFVVNQAGNVESPIVQTSSDPAFERPALAAVKQWRFEPGRRNGQPVRFRMKVPITFPRGG